MNCITLKNPKASHIVVGRADELWMNWSTKYKGPLLIHVGLGFNERLQVYGDATEDVQGAIIGFVKLLGMGKRNHGLTQWRLAFPMVFETPIVCRGNIKLFEVDDELVIKAINAATKPIKAEPTPTPEQVYPPKWNRLQGFTGD